MRVELASAHAALVLEAAPLFGSQPPASRVVTAMVMVTVSDDNIYSYHATYSHASRQIEICANTKLYPVNLSIPNYVPRTYLSSFIPSCLLPMPLSMPRCE